MHFHQQILVELVVGLLLGERGHPAIPAGELGAQRFAEGERSFDQRPRLIEPIEALTFQARQRRERDRFAQWVFHLTTELKRLVIIVPAFCHSHQFCGGPGEIVERDRFTGSIAELAPQRERLVQRLERFSRFFGLDVKHAQVIQTDGHSGAILQLAPDAERLQVEGQSLWMLTQNFVDRAEIVERGGRSTLVAKLLPQRERLA